MAYKIYGKGNYLFIDDTVTGLRHENLKRNVFVTKEAASSTTYKIEPIQNIGGIKLTLTSTDILKENDTPYSDAEWQTFYTENTGNFSQGGGAVLTREVTVASSSTPTPNADTTDIYIVTALAAGATFGAPTGTPVQGQKLIIRIKDNATARTLAYNAIYRAIGVTLPTTTVISKTLYLGLIYNATDTKWDVVAVGQEA